MDVGIIKPRLVYFQWDHKDLPVFLKMHMILHVKCLSEFFDVILINYDSNYKKVCDTYHPDLVMFESGYKSLISKKPLIKETNSHPYIPKIGLHNGDSWCDCRVGFFSDMEQWGVETFFTIGTTMAENTPSITENLYVWPNFIDSDVFYDYGEIKNTPILFNGMRNSLYPWRNKIYDIASKKYPSITFPHTGYEKQSTGMIYGEKYARAINASWFVPACGTLVKEVVRKHFEIPGSNSCLITEKSASLEAAGFKDMQNCVFADQNDVLYKLDYLFRNVDELKRITAEGYSLVHTNHTYKQRNQILQWYNLKKNLNFDEKIIQNQPFGTLSVVKISSNVRSRHIRGEGIHLTLLHEGDKNLWSGKYDVAEANYLKCLEYIFWMSEPKLKLAICHLFKGEAELALNWVLNPIQQNLGSYSKAFSPDPIEWAYFIIALLCNGKGEEALIRANQFSALFHPELNRSRLIINFILDTDLNNINFIKRKSLKPIKSIHQLPQTEIKDWIINLQSMLVACQQVGFAEKLNVLMKIGILDEEELFHKSGNSKKSLKMVILKSKIHIIEKLNHSLNEWNAPNRKTGLPAISIYDFSIRIFKWARIDKFKDLIVRFKSIIKRINI